MNDIKQNPDSVAVIIPAFNSQNRIHTAISSVLSQTLPPDEILIIDDGSTDNTADIAKSFGDNINYIYQNNSGPGSARNKGILMSSSKWVAFLDSDDTWLPQKLEMQTALLKRNPHLKWVCSNEYIITDNNKTTQSDPGLINNALNGKEFFADYIIQCTNGGDTGHTSTMLIDRETCNNAGNFPEDTNYAEDLELWLRIALCHPNIGYVNTPLAYYNIHDSNITHNTYAANKILALCSLYERTLPLSLECNKVELFNTYFSARLRQRIYPLYCKKHFDIIQQVLSSPALPLSNKYISTMKSLTSLPTITKFFGKRIVRLLGYHK